MSCNKDRLTGNLDQFEGTYTWSHSVFKADWWSSETTRVNAENRGYTASIKLDNKSKIYFYANSEEIHKSKFRIAEQNEEDDGTLNLVIEMFKEDNKSEDLDFNDQLSLRLQNDTLDVGDFPGNVYDSTISGNNYFIRN